MNFKLTRILAALCGVLGTVTLIGSFVINPAPPAGSTIAQLADFANQHSTTIILGGWLQGNRLASDRALRHRAGPYGRGD